MDGLTRNVPIDGNVQIVCGVMGIKSCIEKVRRELESTWVRSNDTIRQAVLEVNEDRADGLRK